MSSLAVLFVGDDLYYATNRVFASSCQVAWWLWSVGTTLSSSAVVAKMYCVYSTCFDRKVRT